MKQEQKLVKTGEQGLGAVGDKGINASLPGNVTEAILVTSFEIFIKVRT